MLLASTLTMLSSYLYIVIDTLTAGLMLGNQAMAGVSMISPFFTFTLFVGSVISQGSALSASNSSGKYDRKEAADYYSTGMTLAVVVGILATLFLVFVMGGIGETRTRLEESLDFANGYFSAFCFIPPVMFIHMMLYAMALEEGREMLCFPVAVLELVAKAILSGVLAAAFGVAGLAAATGIVYLLGSAVFLAGFIKKRPGLEIRPLIKWRLLLLILIVGFNDSMSALLMTFLGFTLNIFVLVVFGVSSYMILPIIINLIEIGLSFLTGLTGTMETMVCLYYGENNLHGVTNTLRYSIRVAFVSAVAFSAVVFLISEALPHFYGITGSQVDEAAQALRLFIPYSVFFMVEYCYSEYYGCVGRTKYSMSIIALLIYVMPAAGAVIGAIIAGRIFDMETWNAAVGVWTGIGLGYAACFLLDYVLVKVKERKELLGYTDHTLIDQSEMLMQHMIDIDATPENVSAATEEVARLLRVEGVEEKRIAKAELLVEELCMQRIEREKNRKFEIEITLIIDVEISLIIRDDGLLSDETEKAEELEEGSLRNYVLAQAARSAGGRYIPVAEKNRSMFVV